MDNQSWAGGEMAPGTPGEGMADIAGENLREGPQNLEDIGERFGLDGSEYAPGRYSEERAQELGRETLEAVPYARVPVPPGMATPPGAIATPPETATAERREDDLIGTDGPKMRDRDGLGKEDDARVERIIAKTRDNPRERLRQLTAVQRKLLLDRYNRRIGDRNDSGKEMTMVDKRGRNLFAEKKAA